MALRRLVQIVRVVQSLRSVKDVTVFVVVKSDALRKTGHSVIQFWKQRYDPAMGGLIYFVLIFPAVFSF